jgi:hypothetical protein
MSALLSAYFRPLDRFKQALEGAKVDGSPLLKPSHITDALKV